MQEPSPINNFHLGTNIILDGVPDAARNLRDLAQTSTDPAVSIKYIELAHKLIAKQEVTAGATVNVIFDMSGAISATTTPAPITIEADDQRQDEPLALPAPDADPDAPVEFTDLATLLGLQEPVDLER